MQVSRLGTLVRVLLLSLILTFTTTALVPMLSSSERSTAVASVAFDKSDDKKKEKDKEKAEKDANEDRVINGQVLEINTLKDPPELILGSVDGETVVRVLKTDEIVRNGVRLGDYIQADGEKINEQLFEATQISVSEHYTGQQSENDNKN
jgi:hypothetical protein